MANKRDLTAVRRGLVARCWTSVREWPQYKRTIFYDCYLAVMTRTMTIPTFYGKMTLCRGKHVLVRPTEGEWRGYKAQPVILQTVDEAGEYFPILVESRNVRRVL
jgi:hypothetical protein